MLSPVSARLVAYRALCSGILFAMAALPALASGAEITGSIQGYFLTQAGQLQVRTVAIGSAAAPAASEGLHPVWSPYYLSATVASPGPVRHMRVVAADDGAVLYDVETPAPSDTVRLPVQDGSFIGAHSRHGMAWRVELTDGRGRKSEVAVRVTGARLLPMPELKVDWLNFLRIDAARRALREKGDAILPEMGKDAWAYALMGEDHQVAIFNTPHPPGGFGRYRGPLPTRDTVWVGRYARQWPANAGGWTVMIGARPTACLPTFPWWSCLPIGGESTDERASDAAWTVPVIVHEACHACWFARTGIRSDNFCPECADVVPDLRDRALQAAEWEALLEALRQDTQGAVSPLLQDFFALGEMWRTACRHAKAGQLSEDGVATTEGFAYWLGCSGMAPLGAMAKDPGLRVDPFFDGVRTYDKTDQLARLADAERYPSGWTFSKIRPSLWGYAQAQLLDRFWPDLFRRAWKESLSLRDVISSACGYSALSAAQKEVLRRGALEKWQVDQRAAEIDKEEQASLGELQRLELAARAGKALVLRLLCPLGPDETGPLGRGAQPAQVLNGVRLDREGCLFDTPKPCRIRQYQDGRQLVAELRTALDDLDAPVQIRRDGESIEILSKELMIQADHCTARREAGCITVQVVRQASGEGDTTHGDGGDGTPRQVRVPLALLCSDGAQRPGSHHASALVPNRSFAATVEGNFLDADTGQICYQAVDMLQLPPPALLLVPGERYAMTATVSGGEHAQASEVRLYGSDGKLLDDTTPGPSPHSLTVRGAFREPPPSPPDATTVWEAYLPLHRLALGLGPAGSCGADSRLDLLATYTEGRAANHTALTVIVTDPAGARKGNVDVRIRAKSSSQSGRWTDPVTTGLGEGTVTFRPIVPRPDPDGYIVELALTNGCRYECGPFPAVMGRETTVNLAVSDHHAITGRIRLSHVASASNVRVELLKGSQVIMSGAVNQVGADGVYDYTIGAAPPAGFYTVRATYTGAGEGNKGPLCAPVTVPDDCAEDGKTLPR